MSNFIFSQNADDLRKKYDLKGNISSLIIEKYESKPVSNSINPKISTEKIFFTKTNKLAELSRSAINGKNKILNSYNKNGDLLSTTKFSGSKIYSSIKYVYNEKKQVIEEIKFDKEGVLSESTKINYNYEGKEITRTVFNSLNKIERKTEITYNKKGRDDKTIYFEKDGKIGSYYFSSHNKLGKLVEDKVLTADNRIRRKTLIFYNENNLEVKRIRYTWDERLQDSIIKLYDENLLIRKTYYKSSGKVDYKILYEYDSNKNLTKYVSLNPKDEQKEKWIYKYDKSNNIEILKYGSDDNSIKRKTIMKYDYKNNLIEKTEFKFLNSKLEKSTWENRTIEYYK